MTPEPTDEDIVDFISTYSHLHGYSPTVREIGEWIGRSPSATHSRLKVLVRQKRILMPGFPRSIVVLK